MVGIGMAYPKESKIYLGRFLSSSGSMSAGWVFCENPNKSQNRTFWALYGQEIFVFY